VLRREKEYLSQRRRDAKRGKANSRKRISTYTKITLRPDLSLNPNLIPCPYSGQESVIVLFWLSG
jgi:hypothetical protein